MHLGALRRATKPRVRGNATPRAIFGIASDFRVACSISRVLTDTGSNPPGIKQTAVGLVKTE
jgi:hypothetical protein